MVLVLIMCDSDLLLYPPTPSQVLARQKGLSYSSLDGRMGCPGLKRCSTAFPPEKIHTPFSSAFRSVSADECPLSGLTVMKGHHPPTPGVQHSSAGLSIRGCPSNPQRREKTQTLAEGQQPNLQSAARLPSRMPEVKRAPPAKRHQRLLLPGLVARPKPG